MWCFAIRFSFVCASTPCRSANIFSNPPGVTPNNTGLRPYVLERVGCPGRNEDKGPGGRAHNTFAHFEVELTAHNVTEFSFHSVQVRRRAALRRDSLAKDADHAPSLLSCRQQFGDICLSALLAAVMGCFAGQEDECLSLSRGDRGRSGEQDKKSHCGK